MGTDNEERENLHTTLDSYQAGWLKVRGHIHELIEERDKYVYAFKSCAQLRQDLADYYNGATIEALRFANAIKQLKSEIFSRKDKDGFKKHEKQKG